MNNDNLIILTYCKSFGDPPEFTEEWKKNIMQQFPNKDIEVRHQYRKQNNFADAVVLFTLKGYVKPSIDPETLEKMFDHIREANKNASLALDCSAEFLEGPPENGYKTYTGCASKTYSFTTLKHEVKS